MRERMHPPARVLAFRYLPRLGTRVQRMRRERTRIHAGGKACGLECNYQCDTQSEADVPDTELHFHKNHPQRLRGIKIVNLNNYDARSSPKHGTKVPSRATVR